MAEFNTIGIEDIERHLRDLAENAPEVIDDMLNAGADVLVPEYKASIGRHVGRGRKRRSIGTLANSIGKSPFQNEGSKRCIYVLPEGDQPHGRPRVSNAGGTRRKKRMGLGFKPVSNKEVGFILEYGHSSMSGSPWMSEAYENNAGKVEEAEWDVWRKYNDGG